ncbi:MAG: hypothetical protein K2W96_21565, partial [Gemmataceae bacterium]|nr:hypothetical protein [Gemmataceae bacterium]
MLALMLLLAADPDPTPTFEADLREKGDLFEAKLEKGAPMWTIHSRAGIGTAAVRLAKGEAPKKVLICLPRLRNLASFIVRVGGLEAGCTLGETIRLDARGKKTD